MFSKWPTEKLDSTYGFKKGLIGTGAENQEEKSFIVTLYVF
jgi:hypothetical protein